MSKKTLVQQGDKSIYIEENTGKIEIHTPTGVEIINAFNPLELEKLKADFKDRFEEILGLLRGQLNHRIIRHHLTSMPFMLDDFIGRQQELKKIEQSLFSETGNILLLVNGRGGVGKTTLAARYYSQNHHKYAHVAWVLSERSITDAILNLAFPLQAKEVLQLPRKQALQEILRRMAELPKPCLLVIDNANELQDLQTSYESLRKCSNFHLLLTTRIRKFTGAKMHEIKGLPYPQALKLFEKHYQELHTEEQKIFKGIHQAINQNTLIVEILAKNLATVNEYDDSYQLNDLLHDLQNRGLLALRQTEHIALHYHEYQHTKPEDIIYQMYELSPLQAAEKALLSVFAVLPPEGIALQQLQDLLPSFEDLKNHLRQLDHKGWIEFSKEDKKFKCSPVIQEVVRKRNDARLLEDIAELLKSLNTKLDNDGVYFTGSSYEEAALLSQYGESILLVPAKNNTALKVLSERLGTYCRNVGQLEKALHYFQAYQQRSKGLLQQQADNEWYKNSLALSFSRIGNIYTDMGQLQLALQAFEQYQKLQEALHHDFPENETFKNNLAIAFEKLGDTHTALGNLKKALTFFEKDAQLTQELYEDFPQNVNFKNGLAIAFERLGTTNKDLGNLKKALAFFEQYAKLMQQLYDDFPQNVNFKNGLAIAFEKLGQTHTALGNLDKALEFFEQLAELMQELYDDFPQNVNFKNGLAIAFSKLGDTHTALGNLDKALAFFEQYRMLKRELYDDFPQNVNFKNGLAIAFSNLGVIHRDLGNLDKALVFFEQTAKLMQELQDEFPQNVNFKNGLAIAFSKLGDTHTALGNLDKALAFFEQYRMLKRELYDDFPQNVNFKNSLALAYQWLGWFHEKQHQNLVDANKNYQKSHQLLVELTAQSPDFVKFQENLDWVKSAIDRTS